MAISKEEALQRASKDLAGRLGVGADRISAEGIEDADFPDMALGAPLKDELSGQMITPGWRIRLSAGDKGRFEYRANRNQIRLFNFKGSNYRIE